jgi:phosphoribosylamine--glycine ligase
MNVLLIGSGGREHAIARKIAGSRLLTKLFIAPGNPGTSRTGENISGLTIQDPPSVIRTCREKRIDLVIIGPETPLAMGLADALAEAGIKVFGPSKAAAQIETSKAFSKDFMRRHAIPTARYKTFTSLPEAIAHLDEVDYRVVIKASGLAAGKGVFLPESSSEAIRMLESMLTGNVLGKAGRVVVIEERLLGEEVSLLAFSDGVTIRPMIPAQDHKRALDGDLGPNTGGMGAFAPVPACPPEMVSEMVRVGMQPAIDGLREEGIPFVGVLYGGFMLTPDGPRLIEFNCRFGDPETQVVLPLLESDLLEIVTACVDGRLGQVDIRWKDGAAACVVLASGGYPGTFQTGFEIMGLGGEDAQVIIYHGGTGLVNGKVVSTGGRVLCVTGLGADLNQALSAAYKGILPIRFESMYFRTDIGRRAIGGPR